MQNKGMSAIGIVIPLAIIVILTGGIYFLVQGQVPDIPSAKLNNLTQNGDLEDQKDVAVETEREEDKSEAEDQKEQEEKEELTDLDKSENGEEKSNEEPNQQEKENDLYASLDNLKISSSIGESEDALCFMSQKVFIDINSTFSDEEAPRTIPLEYFIDNQSFGILNLSSQEGKFSNGKHRVGFDSNEWYGGHTLKIVLDPKNKISESNEENNEATKQISKVKVDLYVKEISYDPFFGQIEIDITRSPVGPDCPKFAYPDSQENRIARIYINSQEISNPFPGFMGFSKSDKSKGSIKVSYAESGEHSIKVVLDPDNFVDESNESNNEFVGTITIP